MGKFNSNQGFFQPTRFSNSVDTALLPPYSVQVANIRDIPIWEMQGITQEEYEARQNALVYDASYIEQEIIEAVENNIDPITDAAIISLYEHEDEETQNALETSTTVVNETTNLTVGDIIQQSEANIAALQINNTE